MVYGKRHRVTGALDRLSSIKPLWDLLKHLPDAEWKKLQIRQQCIWAKAFYGCANSPLAKSHIQDLRAALKSLKRSRAGANPMLALSLQDPMTTDLASFKSGPWSPHSAGCSVSKKCGATSWRTTRNPNQGPFRTSIKVFTLVGWSVEVPGFYDHYGFWVSFLDTTDGILRSLAEDAWGQCLAHEVTNRKDFSGCRALISWLLDVYSEDWISRSESFYNLPKMAPFWMPSRRASSTWRRVACVVYVK